MGFCVYNLAVKSMMLLAVAFAAQSPAYAQELLGEGRRVADQVRISVGDGFNGPKLFDGNDRKPGVGTIEAAPAVLAQAALAGHGPSQHSFHAAGVSIPPGPASLKVDGPPGPQAQRQHGREPLERELEEWRKNQRSLLRGFYVLAAVCVGSAFIQPEFLPVACLPAAVTARAIRNNRMHVQGLQRSLRQSESQ